MQYAIVHLLPDFPARMSAKLGKSSGSVLGKYPLTPSANLGRIKALTIWHRRRQPKVYISASICGESFK
jgi:hypothetical protein